MCAERALVVGTDAGLRGLEMRASEAPVESSSGTPPDQVQQPSPSSSPLDHPSPSESVVHADCDQPL